MRAISLQCPHCGAKLEAPEAAYKVACTYCGTESRIQHRTRFLERKIEMPPPPPQEKHLLVAKQKHRKRWLVGFISLTSLFPLLIAGSVTYFTLRQTGGLARISEAIDKATETVQNGVRGTENSWTFSGTGSVILFDVNADGAQDLIAPVRYVQNNDSYRIAAFDGLVGDKLWETEVFGNHKDANQGKTARNGAYVVQSDSRGNIAGYSASTGGTLWKVSMGETLEELCAEDEAHLALGLRDKKWKRLNLADGSFEALDGRPDDCARVSEYAERGQPSHHFASDTRKQRVPKVKIDGMRIEDSLELASEPGRYLLIGHKTPGTRVPMVALIHASELDQTSEQEDTSGRASKRSKKKQKSELLVDWSSELPALDPLAVKEGAPEFVAMNSNFVVALYTRDNNNPHVVCFSREGGRRLWDKPLPDKSSYVLRALDISKSRVFVSQWGRLDAFDAGGGALVFTLGN